MTCYGRGGGCCIANVLRPNEHYRIIHIKGDLLTLAPRSTSNEYTCNYGQRSTSSLTITTVIVTWLGKHCNEFMYDLTCWCRLQAILYYVVYKKHCYPHQELPLAKEHMNLILHEIISGKTFKICKKRIDPIPIIFLKIYLIQFKLHKRLTEMNYHIFAKSTRNKYVKKQTNHLSTDIQLVLK